ncbi:hypothetical protein Bca52824_071011 [Brassica carinata]|uniref:Gfo/Idh/MocA-like oxidoreductase N-terminal domain-containing protein n=1 Tax=Brassica carinata TaxID=52824 RepID=A0A8X7Q5Y0_BRACI|nr:hypothetical protein Bca52824_071011 [Brassica carinata]
MAANSAITKYGIVGIGMMGREHLINLHHLRHQNLAVVSIADPHPPSQLLAVELARSFNWDLKVFSGHEELLESETCDVIVVSSPNMTHHRILMDIIAYETAPRSRREAVMHQYCRLQRGSGGCEEKVGYGGASWVGV